MKPIREMIIFIEPDCIACVRVLETAKVLRHQNIVADLLNVNRIEDPESCMKFGVQIFPAVFINGRLTFYGEFSVEEARRFIHRSVQN